MTMSWASAACPPDSSSRRLGIPEAPNQLLGASARAQTVLEVCPQILFHRPAFAKGQAGGVQRLPHHGLQFRRQPVAARHGAASPAAGAGPASPSTPNRWSASTSVLHWSR